MTRTITQLPVGAFASFTQSCGDAYNGQVAEWHGDVVTICNYSAWYDGDAAPFDSPHADDTVSFRISGETRIEAF